MNKLIKVTAEEFVIEIGNGKSLKQEREKLQISSDLVESIKDNEIFFFGGGQELQIGQTTFTKFRLDEDSK